MASLIQMEPFTYRPESANLDWPLWKQRLQNFFTINRIGMVVVTADPQANPPVVAETTLLAHGYLLHLGGPKVVEINNANTSANNTLNYVSLVALLDTRFATVNTRISDYQFRSCSQLEDETLADYANRLRVLARSAKVADELLDAQILSVILNNTVDNDTRMKCLDEATTLTTLLEWRRGTDLKNSCASFMDNKRNSANILAVRNNKPQQRSNRTVVPTQKCFLCGFEYPHVNKMCPASGKRCNKCGRLNHFESVCKDGKLNRQSSSRDYESGAHNSPRPNSNSANGQNYSSNNHSNSSNGQNRHNNSNTRLQHLRSINYQTGRSSSSVNGSPPMARAIDELNDDELIDAFESFYRSTQLSSTRQVDDSVIRQINLLQLNSEAAPIELIHELTAQEHLGCPRSYIQLGNNKIRHLIDSGTDLNIILASTYNSLKTRPLLRESKVKAYGFHSKTHIPLLGEFTTHVKFKHKVIMARYLVLDGVADDIIGFSAATALGIIKIECDNDPNMVNTIKTKRVTFTNNSYCFKDPTTTHPELFTGKVGCLKNFKVSLDVDPHIKPVQQPAYPVPFALMKLTKAKLDTLEAQGIISKVNGEKLTWISPLHPVAKMNEKNELVDVRVTCNAKQLNKAIIPQKRHIPSIPELTNELKGCKWFSSLDLNDAFNQIMFDYASRPLTAMSTIWGIYIWNRLNMGLSIASELFQEIMEKVLEGIPSIKIALDDLMVHTEDPEEHEKVVIQCLDRLAEHGMTLNINKCKFFQPEIDFFGVTISKDGVRPKKGKFQDLQDCRPPTNTKEVHSFLGLTGYFKNRSPYQSSIDKPLRNLLKGNAPFKWNNDEQKAYELLKATVIDKEMAFFDHNLETELYVDAGPNGCSSFLTQINHTNKDIKLIRCDSHSFTEAELNYSHLEKEAFACVWACKTNHIYVYGRRFKCITDALSVKKIFEEDKSRKRTPIRFIRWKSDLSVYNVEFVHRDGSKNIADYLSRRFNKPTSNITNFATAKLEAKINSIVTDCIPTDISLAELIEATTKDEQLVEVKKGLKLMHLGDKINHTLIKPYKNIWNELSTSSHGLVMRNDILIIPNSLRQTVVNYAHEGHIGIQLCKRLLRNICWFPKMDSLIEESITDCIACQCNVQGTTTEPILPTLMPPESWHTIAIDFSSQSPTGEYQLATYDENSRQTILKLSKDMTTASAIRICKLLFSTYGIPKVIKSDNGPAFISHEWAEFAKRFNFKHQKITPLHPEANAGAERVMKNNNKSVRCASVTNTPWKTVVAKWLKRYNQTPHSATGYSPNMLLFGHDGCNILPILKPRSISARIRIQARENDAKYKEKMKFYADRYQHAKHRDFNKNNPVLHKWNRNNKYKALFDPHPYRVKTIKGSMITAERSNHQVTRNSKFFKIISEKCFENAMKLQSKTNKPHDSTSFMQSKPISHESHQEPEQRFELAVQTPPETPADSTMPIIARHTSAEISTPNHVHNTTSNQTRASSPNTEIGGNIATHSSSQEQTANNSITSDPTSTRTLRNKNTVDYTAAYRMYPKANKKA